MYNILQDQKLRNSIFDLLIKAGDKIMTYYRSETFETFQKEDKSPVTTADLASDEVISRGLAALTPSWKVISEEKALPEQKEQKQTDYFWILDPLDGTKEFLHRTDEFSINLALIHGKEVVAGYIYLPVFKEMYYGVKGHGAYQHIDHSEEKRLHVNSFSLADENLKVVTSRNHIDDGTRVYLEKLNNPNLISMGSALKFINIANGKADYYPRMIQIMEWDTAAGQIIIEEAGGSLVNANTGEPLTYNKPGMINPYFIASGKII